MERITGKQVQSMMEAVHQVYAQQEQVEVEQLDEAYPKSERLAHSATQKNKELEAQAKATAAKIDAGEIIKTVTAGPILNRLGLGQATRLQRNQQGNLNVLPGSAGGLDKTIRLGGRSYDRLTQGDKITYVRRDKAPVVGDREKPPVVQPPKPKPAPQSSASNLKPSSPNTAVSPKTGEETKFERRLPTMAELRAAQAARAAAKAGGASAKEAEYQAVKAGVGVSKGTVADPKIAADAARKAELERIRQRAASQTKVGQTATVASTADPKPAAAQVKPVGTPVQGGVKPVAGAPTASAANTKFGVSAKPLGSPAPILKKKEQK